MFKTEGAWDGAHFGPMATLNKLGRGPLGGTTFQILRFYALWFQTRRFVYVFYTFAYVIHVTHIIGPFLESGSRLWTLWFQTRRFLCFPISAYLQHVTPGNGHFWSQVQKLNKFGRYPIDDATYQIARLYALWFKTRSFLCFPI